MARVINSQGNRYTALANADSKELKALKGTLRIPYSQFPPNKVHNGCSYYTTLAMLAAKLLENVDSCEVGKGNAEFALLLVGYADEVKLSIFQIVMEFMFGDAFFRKTNGAAEKVAFDRQFITRNVTLEGDLFQPGGVMTGECFGFYSG
ncbi:hypothetical protein CTI12_AA344690 [Artemisia annua]|uniref:Very-long-chain aldehyde decarbonylase CER1-like C-terminal domain-containing protein n=1 Tax=Artemisia annua TaxID=35608 RepID=A0A2U1MT16_ARTAN|nr:hypothetical protein CTI12_AA344690 [Artemisia annua]